MTDKQPEALRIAALLESVILDIPPTAAEIGIAALLRTQHAAIERKDALLRQALEAFEANDWKRSLVVMASITKELLQ